jgi:hypothetical protein
MALGLTERLPLPLVQQLREGLSEALPQALGKHKSVGLREGEAESVPLRVAMPHTLTLPLAKGGVEPVLVA